ncbi:hypothetical protein F4860DRAFT_515388 [Xylaria cubensis]|nr:hypothetical protein F4860DRAFT_515388 [Xylaria cubensis]
MALRTRVSRLIEFTALCFLKTADGSDVVFLYDRKSRTQHSRGNQTAKKLRCFINGVDDELDELIKGFYDETPAEDMSVGGSRRHRVHPLFLSFLTILNSALTLESPRAASPGLRVVAE